MNTELFSDSSPGRLQGIHINGTSDWSFIPDPLPRTWEPPNADIWELLAQAREELARLDGLGRHMPDFKLLLKPLQQREALRSSSLEGTYATPEQLLLFGIDPKEPRSPQDPKNAWKEVFNYSKAIEIGQQMLEEVPFSNRLIKELHRCLLEGVRGHRGTPGQFRDIQVQIGSDRRFIPPPSADAVTCLNTLENDIHEEHSINPLIFCFMVHYQFETIHPFRDGNGRTGRLLLALMIYKLCKLKSPWLYLSAFFEKYRDEYITTLFNVSAKGDWKNWIAFCLRATIHQSIDSIVRFDRLVALKEQYMNRISAHGGNIRLHTLIEKLFGEPILTIPQATKILGVSYPTAKSDIDILMRLAIVEDSTLSKSPKLFVAPEIISVAYGD